MILFSLSASMRMDGAVALVMMLLSLTVFLDGVSSKARLCYFGPPPEPDPNNPDDWMKQVMQEIRERCPGRRGPTPPVDCLSPEPLGLEDRTIPDDHIRESSIFDTSTAGAEARLNNVEGWVPSVFHANPWIGVDLAERTVVSGVTTQGCYDEYTSQYKVAYKKQPQSVFDYVTDASGEIELFIGNTDAAGQVSNMFLESVVATALRIEPTAFGNNMYCLRMELLGCRLE